MYLARRLSTAASLLALAACQNPSEGDGAPDSPGAGTAEDAAEAAARAGGDTTGASADVPAGTTAAARLEALANSGVSGAITFVPTKVGLEVRYELTGLPAGRHGFHVHEGTSCGPADLPEDADTEPDPGGAAGGHFNPQSTPHGAPDAAPASRHAGDVGNVEAGADGRASGRVVDALAALEGPNAIVGRAVVVHENPDDLASQPGGNAGGRLACGIVELSTPDGASPVSSGSM